MERDATDIGVFGFSSNFNSHAHVERDENVVDMGKQILDFNSHAHVERDLSFLIMKCIFQISTHTLTWSVTTPI